MTATDQEIANILAGIQQNLNHHLAVELANAVFQITGKPPEDKRADAHLERGPRPPGPRGND